MAENRGIWGIDIGQAGLKAIRLRYAEAARQVIAVAFDYVPHPKILSQPDALPEELIPQALERFLSRNDVHGDGIAISVPGQAALARFIQLPPVEASKVAEIVKYEARQQIPFALEDVIWDFQTLGGGVEESGFMLEAEVGLFAMKREQVMQQLRPFSNAKIEPELIQIAPLALYNFLSYDRLGIRPDDESEGAAEYTIVLDMGADDTTLLVSNGQKIWIRNVPIGGNHFTRALTKDMKLTFAKAEHLKCNATKSPDPRAVFQALRPVFNDYVSEIQRSIGYFSSVNRDARITKVLGLGNGFKLAGLQKFLQQHLQYDVERVENFQSLVGDTVLNSPLFQENILSFAVPYGLALQAMDLTRIHTTLLPAEIATARKIRLKKPWAVVTAATLLFGVATSAAGYARVWKSVSDTRFGEAIKAVEDLKSEVGSLKAAYDKEKSENQTIKDQGSRLVKNIDDRVYWLEVYKAINECLPRDRGNELDEADIQKRHRIKLTSITAQRKSDLSTWYEELGDVRKAYMLPGDREVGPEGPGYVFTLRGVHYHHGEKNESQGVIYVRETLLKNLKSWKVGGEGGILTPVRQLGITHPTIITSSSRDVEYYPSGKKPTGMRGYAGQRGYDMSGRRSIGSMDAAAAGMRRGMAAMGPGMESQYRMSGRANRGRLPLLGDRFREQLDSEKTEEKVITIPQTSFLVQFVWKPTPSSERLDEPSAIEAEGEEPAADGKGADNDNAADAKESPSN